MKTIPLILSEKNMNRINLFNSHPSILLSSLLAFFLLFMTPVNAYSAEVAGNTLPSYTGGTGLLDMPTARIMPDWHVRAHYSWTDPYYTFGVTSTFLPWLEVNARMVGIEGLPALSENYGDYKDKVLDFKIWLYEEDEYWPDVAVGFNDIHGTALFASRYLAVSKLVGPVDVTLGVGQGILAGESTEGTVGSPGDASIDAGFDFLTSGPTENKTRLFGGAELRLTENLSLLAEYSSLDYEVLKGSPEPADSPVNFGIKYRLAQNSLLSASYMRGKDFGWSIAADFPLNAEGILPWTPQPFWVPGEDLKEKARQATNEELSLIIQAEVVAEKFSNVRTSVSAASLWVEIENPTYLSNTKALGRALRVVCSLAPPRIHWVHISLKSNDIILLTIRLGRQDFEAFIDERMDGAALLEFADITNEGVELRQEFLRTQPGASPLTDIGGSKKHFFGIKQSWQTLFNDPSGFLRHKFSLVWKAGYLPWAGGLIRAQVRTPLYNDIASSGGAKERDDAVRTDFMNYLSDSSVRLEKLAFDQVFDLPQQFLARAEIGLFESAYAGVGGEVFRFFQDGRLGAGFEGEIVKKRDIDNDFKLLEDSLTYNTCFLNMYYKLLPELGLDVGLKLGRFLAGDWGGRFDISRTYKHFTLGLWYTVTDTSIFESLNNIGYHDKGVWIAIPFSVFTNKDSRGKLFYGLRPWTRDPGQTVSQINSLYPMGNTGNIGKFERTVEELKD